MANNHDKEPTPKRSATDIERQLLRDDILAVSGARLRQRISQNSEENNAETPRGFFGKLFGH